MTRTPIELAKALGLEFSNVELLHAALTHRSAASHHNERLEFLGDAILGLIIAEYLYLRFPKADEGALSRLRASLVNQSTLAGLARKINMGDFLILGSGELKSGGFRRDSILSDAYEALIAAVALDQGHESCKQWVLLQFKMLLSELSLDDWQKDPKTRLQELLQGRGLELPVYSLIATVGYAHDQQFRVECIVDLPVQKSTGVGTTRKKAEQDAATVMLSNLAEFFRLRS